MKAEQSNHHSSIRVCLWLSSIRLRREEDLLARIAILRQWSVIKFGPIVMDKRKVGGVGSSCFCKSL